MSNNGSDIALDILQLQVISQRLFFVLSFIILIGGVLGNLLNLVIFLTIGNYKNNPYSLYMLIRCFSDLNMLLIGLTTQILSYGFQTDLTMISRVWCKTRSAFLFFNSHISLNLLCFQSIDVYFRSSALVALRQKSNIRTARYLIVGIFCVWFVHELPYCFLQDLVTVGNTSMCVPTNVAYAQYRSYFVSLGIFTLIPASVIIVFGYLTYRNLKIRTARPLISAFTRQMFYTTFSQSVSVLLFNGSLVVLQIYFLLQTNVSMNSYRQAQDRVTNSFFIVDAYMIYATSFYCYCFSQRFRKQVIMVLKQLLGGARINQVAPMA